MPWRRTGRSTSTTPWSKSISITRSAITHSRPMETCWYAEIVHSCPSTVLAPIETTPSWQRIFVPCPSHDQRPSSIRASLPIWSTTRGPMKARPSSFRRGANSFRRASRTRSRAYLAVSMRWRRMKRSNVSRPPWRGGGGPRRPSSTPVGGGPASSWVAASMAATMLFAQDVDERGVDGRDCAEHDRRCGVIGREERDGGETEHRQLGGDERSAAKPALRLRRQPDAPDCRRRERSRDRHGNVDRRAPHGERGEHAELEKEPDDVVGHLHRPHALVPLPPVPPLPSTAADLAERLLAGEKRALARAISLVENDDPEGWALVREVFPSTGRAAVVGFTGPPGVGKSTLIGALVKSARARERKVAVLSIDPSSPFTKGALLGDRIRLTDHFLDPGVFIRSMASRGSLGGLSEATLQAALLMDAAGNDDVLLETVGVGQAEVDIIDHADTVVLVLMPGSGDSIQALKAGVMEIPDVIVVNKSDHPLTDTMIREIRGVLSLGPRTSWRVPIVKTEAALGEGIDELVEKISEHRAFIEQEGTLSERRRRNLMNEVVALAAGRLRRSLEE